MNYLCPHCGARLDPGEKCDCRDGDGDMYFRIGDPLDDFERQDIEQSRKLERLPNCESCGEPIQQEDAVCLDGIWYCDKCLANFRQDIDWED